MQTAYEILKQTLRENGWDGLSNPDIECGCGLDAFAPCGRIEEGCCPAKGNWEVGFHTYGEPEENEHELPSM